MGCSGCATKTINAKGLPVGCKNNGWCSTGGCGDKLDAYDWLSNIFYDDQTVHYPMVEVKFKGTRKEFYKNVYNLDLEIGDPIAVESATQGWDLGVVSLTGELVRLQMKKNRLHEDSPDVRKILRKATPQDLDKYEEGKNLEYETMLRARRMANSLGLVMKLSDVEYQGDRTKATFFYTAEGRVDFRELIKVLAREFKVKVEMRQIGLRQEAGRLGGIGSCGRELCCSTWLTDFNSVPTTAARYQNLFLNPLKLSGQCGRLKCCLNYELDIYVEALNEFPEDNIELRTERGIAKVEKVDILKRVMLFKLVNDHEIRFYPLYLEQVKQILEMNEQGKMPADLSDFEMSPVVEEKPLEFKDVVGEESLDRFDHLRNKKRKKKRKGPRNQNPGQQGQQGQNRNRPRPSGNNPNRN